MNGDSNHRGRSHIASSTCRAVFQAHCGEARLTATVDPDCTTCTHGQLLLVLVWGGWVRGGVGFGTSRDLQLLQGPHLPQLGRHLQAKTQKQSPQHCSPISLRRGRDGVGTKQSFFKRSKISGQGRRLGGEKRAFFELTVRLEVVLVLPWVVPLSLLHLLLLLTQAACSWPHRLGDHWLRRNY